MDQHTANYIVKYFPRLMSMEERAAWWHHFAMSKIEQVPNGMEGSEAETWRQGKVSFYREQGLLSSDPSVTELLSDGYDAFIQRTAERIHAEESEEVFYNNCPSCGALARTPQSKQCRHCGHSWHETVAATFRHKATHIHNLKPGFLIFEGIVEKGEIAEGQLVDLTYYGVNLKAEIDEVRDMGDRTQFDFPIADSELRKVLVQAGTNIEPINIER